MSLDTDWIIGVVSLLLTGAGFPIIVRCAAHGKIPPNGLIGIRVGPIDSSDFVWQSAHKAALPAAVIAGIFAIICGVTSVIFHNSPEVRGYLLLAGFLSLLGIGTVSAVIAYFKARRCAFDSFSEELE